MGKMIGITEFKARCIALLDEMERSGEAITITRRGKPALMLSARELHPPRDNLFGGMKGTVTVHGDVVDTAGPDWETAWNAKWDALGLPLRDVDEAP